MKLSETPTVHPTATVTNTRLGRWTEVGEGCSLNEVDFGDYSYIVDGGQAIYATIGKFANIAAATRINPGNHPTWRVTQHHFMYRASNYFDDADDEADFFQWRRDHRVTIGHDVWIGHGAIIMPGITVGDGAVIGTSAVVTKDVAPYTIVAGVPARQLRHRFDPAIAERIRALAWWDWDHATLRARLADFRALSPEAFLERYEGG